MVEERLATGIAAARMAALISLTALRMVVRDDGGILPTRRSGDKAKSETSRVRPRGLPRLADERGADAVF